MVVTSVTLSVSDRGLQQSGQLLISVCSGHVLSVLLSNFERIIFSLKGKIRIYSAYSVAATLATM